MIVWAMQSMALSGLHHIILSNYSTSILYSNINVRCYKKKYVNDAAYNIPINAKHQNT